MSEIKTITRYIKGKISKLNYKGVEKYKKKTYLLNNYKLSNLVLYK